MPARKGGFHEVTNLSPKEKMTRQIKDCLVIFYYLHVFVARVPYKRQIFFNCYVLEMAVMSGDRQSDATIINKDIVEGCIQKKALLYDKNGEEHYNLISALHKSMRNSDPDAAVYWLARMLEAGEDPLFIARRLVRFASEDIGLTDPRTLEMTIAVYNAAHYLGMPECNVHLTQAVVYLSIAAKSNALYMAYENAKKDAQNSLADGVPLHLRNAPTKLWVVH